MELTVDKDGQEGQILEMTFEPRARGWKEGPQGKGVQRALQIEDPAPCGEGLSQSR